MRRWRDCTVESRVVVCSDKTLRDISEGEKSVCWLNNTGETYEAVQLMEHRYAIDVGSRLYRDAGLESVGFGVGDCDRSSSFYVQRILSSRRGFWEMLLTGSEIFPRCVALRRRWGYED